ncbi:MAG: NAD(P)/FAD-dependent oxidoreductase [Parachlamydiaceae bacterium]|nr:NAD(P)/FAD-dependent oxidoreductase [Parachlamydiaceae bacterium]
MQKYDVVIVGAGPAGGQCARDLVKQNKKVLLIEKAHSFQDNNYSSGGGPIEMMSEFTLPDSIVGTYWNTFRINSTKEKAIWHSPTPFGPVIDFDKLREFLVGETVSHGGEFKLACQYQSHTASNNGIELHYKNLDTQEIFEVSTKVLVDATGSDRRVMVKDTYDKNHAIAMTGIEYHVNVQPSVYEKFSKSLNFYLGHKWMPQGYAWIFPMAPNVLKVGVIRYFQNKHLVPYDPSYQHYIDKLLELCGPITTDQIIDKHGKTIYYTIGQKDKRVEGSVIAIGDAISTVNPLGCEGLRHALLSGREAARSINLFLDKKSDNLNSYNQAMQIYFGKKWFFSELMMKSLFTTTNDSMIDRSVKYFSVMNNKEIMDVVFHYRFSHTIKAYFWYYFSLLKGWLISKT